MAKNKNRVFEYRQNSLLYRLKVYNKHLAVINNAELAVPKGIWKIETSIYLMPGYMEIIEQNGNPEIPKLFVYTYIYTESADVTLTINAADDIIIPANSEIALLVPMVAPFNRIELP